MNALDEIRKSVREGALAHAYILEGDAGESRDLLTKQIVQAILCQDPVPERRPCGLCPACNRVHSGTHEDVVTMEQTGKLAYRVQDVAAFTSRLSMNAYGERNIGLIPNADALSEVVQNKLLKTLEEPYPGTVIILAASNREILLDTVRSRCVLLRMESAEEQMDPTEMLEAWNKRFYHEYRKVIDKNFKTQEEAMQFLDAIEVESHNRGEINSVLRIEETRKDILSGMGWKAALKRLWLELRG